MPPYVRFVIPEGYIPAPPPLRFPGNVPIRPRMPVRNLPVYNNRPVPKFKDTDGNSSTTNLNVTSPNMSSASCSTATNPSVTSDTVAENISIAQNADPADNLNTSRESTESHSAVTTTQETVKE